MMIYVPYCISKGNTIIFRIFFFLVLAGLGSCRKAKPKPAKVSLEEKVGQMLLLGFQGSRLDNAFLGEFQEQMRNYPVSGVLFFRHNIENPQQFRKLIQSFRDIPKKHPLFYAIDMEGGKVARLNKKNGYKNFPSAQQVGKWNAQKTYQNYQEMAALLAENGINFNFAPVVDLDLGSPVISGLQRSFSKRKRVVIRHARQMIRAMQEQKILSCLKHFPGHGSAKGDTHKGIVDITRPWSYHELVPFLSLASQAPAIMTAHVYHRQLDAYLPATLSPTILKYLKPDNFRGIYVSDDMHMGAILKRKKNYHEALEESVLLAIKAGINLLVFSNNPLAAKGVKGFQPDAKLLEKVTKYIVTAVATGKLDKNYIDKSYQKILQVKKKYLKRK
ncbi:MAG: glycoside hydrolase family 3 N-terminal domain-containing protein [Spirochaetota bacterium]